MKRKRKLFLLIPLILLVLILVTLIGGYSMFKTELNAIRTIEKLDDSLYIMEYAGDYGFATFLEQGGAKSDTEMAGYISEFLSKGFYKYETADSTYGCSTIAALTPDGSYVFGRNFDWEESIGMIVKAKPDGAYASISTVNLDFLGFSEGFLPEGFSNSFMALAAVYVPLDGMNEKGLCIADLVIEDSGETHQDSGKPDITTTAAIRMILDYAATVDEAVTLLKQYDMHSSASIMHHFAITDETGRAIVVEYVDNVMVVTDTQYVTNFYLAKGDWYGYGSEGSKQRFAKLKSLYEEKNGVMTTEDVKEALMDVSQSIWKDGNWSTEWSIVYEQKAKTINFYHRENYDKPYFFNIK